MIRLDTINRSLQLFLGAAKATNNLQIVVSYSDQTATTYLGGTQLSNSNGTTAVTICSAPAANTIRDIDMISVLNIDTVYQVVTIQYLDTSTTYKILDIELNVGDKLTWTHGSAWQVVDNSGNVKYTVLTTSGVNSFNGRTGAVTLSSSDVTTALTYTPAPSTSGSSILYGNGSGGFNNVTIGSGVSFSGGTLSATGSGGSVTSVALSLPSIFSVSGSPVTSSGTLTGTLNTQSVNTVFAGPSSGSATTPTFRALVSSDIPALSYVSSVSGTGVISSTGGLTPTISISQATSTTSGYLSSTDWNTFNNKGSGTVTSVSATSPVASSGGNTPTISLSSAYGDTLNPYGSKTANYVLASPNGTAGTPSFRALVSNDIPALPYAPTAGSTSITTLGTITSGTWNATPITNSYLANSSITVNGTSISLGGSGTITAKNPYALTIGTGLSGSSYDGSSAVTIAIANSGVTSGTYGSSSVIPVITVNSQGQITSISTQATNAPSYQGTWNASTNTPTLTSSVGTQGYYYVVSVAGTTNLDGNALWSVGDWAIFGNGKWERIPGSTSESFTSLTTTNLAVTGLTGYMYANGSTNVTASTTIPTTALSGTVTNAQLANSSITINGSSVSLGGSTTVTAVAPFSLTFGTGLTGSSYNGSAAVTTAIDTTVVATLTGTQTLTNKSLSGSSNTFTNIPNSALTNSSITINGTSTSLGGSISVGTVTSVALSMPTGFSVSGSPVTSSGTLTVSTTLSGIIKGTGSGFTTAVSGTDYAPATSGSSILYGNGLGGFSNVTIGSGVSFSGGTLSATGSGGTVTSVALTVPSFLSITGSPITSSGTLAIGYSGTALPVANGGTGATTLTGYVYGNGTGAMTASTTIPTTSLSGTITNAQLANSTISGVALGGNLFNLTAGTNITFSTGTTYNGSTAITINAASSTMVYPSAGIANSTGSAWGTSYSTSGSGTVVALNNSPSLTTPSQTSYESWSSITEPTYTAGRLWYDSTQDAMGFFDSISGNDIFLGREVQERAYNNTGSTIPIGSIVYINGQHSQFPTIALAQANASPACNAWGMTNTAIANNSYGDIVVLGKFTGLNTSSFNSGDLLYLSATTAGALTNVAPTGSNYVVPVGYCIYSNPSQGVVSITVPLPPQLFSSIYGTASVSQGGTGLTSVTSGAILYGNGTSALNTLSAGTANYVLTSTGSAPQYVAQSTLSVGSATNATNTAITANTTDTADYITFVNGTTGNLGQLINSSITVNPSKGTITGGIGGGTF